MLQLVDLAPKSLDRYEAIVDGDVINRLRELAAPLRGTRVADINATSYGGGVSELLRSVVPLYRALGIEAQWSVIPGDDEFFEVTKGFHNALQGAPFALTEETKDIYLWHSQETADLLEWEYDYIVVHDPQPAALRALHGSNNARWVWRCHIDTSQPNPEVMAFLKPLISQYDALVFTMEEFVPQGLRDQRFVIIPPAIHILTNFTGIGNMEVNAFQCCSNVVLQKSVREGFGLVVSEALWKGTPVVAGRAGGIPMQMPDGVGGYLIDSIEECAEKTVTLLRDPREAQELGARGRAHVREQFLITRLLADELRLLASLK